jgi:hypothetical protein
MSGSVLSPAYIAAIAADNAAQAVYRKVRDAYRARLVGDEEFCAARAELDRAAKVFDIAFAAEAKVSS